MNNDTWNDLTGSAAVRVAVVGVLAILALFLLVLTLNGVQNFGRPTIPPTNTITVTGTGKATAVPDIAQITFTVTESAATVAAAQSAATDKTNAALAALTKDGVADKDVQTLSYNVSPQYDTQGTCAPGLMCPQMMGDGTGKIIGYEVDETVQAKVRDTSNAGTVLQDLGTLGVQNISGPDFVVDNDETVTDQARAAAIVDAKAQAQVLANQLGVRLGGIVSYSENGNYPGPVYSAYAKGAAMDSVAAAPSLPTGQQETDMNVSITYEIR